MTIPALTLEQAIILTGYTGVTCCDFSAFHADVERRLGHPVWTHQFPALRDEIRTAYKADFMALAPRQPDVEEEKSPVIAFLSEVVAELERARHLFPGDRIMGLALAEEFGELIKALLDEPGKAVWKEAVQTAAMAARVAIDGDGSVDQWRAAKGLDDHRLGAARELAGKEGHHDG